MLSKKNWILFFVALLFSSSEAWPSTKPLFQCITRRPTTSYMLLDEEDHFHLIVNYHLGPDFIPVHTGTLTIRDLPKISSRVESMKKLGPGPKIRFEKNECRREGQFWRCSSQKSQKIGALEVEGVSFSAGELSSNYEGMHWKSVETFFSLVIDKERVVIQLSYPAENCESRDR